MILGPVVLWSLVLFLQVQLGLVVLVVIDASGAVGVVGAGDACAKVGNGWQSSVYVLLLLIDE